MSDSGSKTIAKNTVFMYIRMLTAMVVSLYTSRVVLQELGEVDYGLYQTVGSVIIMLSFINGALTNGTSRFMTYEIGAGNINRLKRTFSTTLISHICMAMLIVVAGETIGLWFVYNKLVISHDRMCAAVFAYHFSIIASVINITQVPYTALIVSHEKLKVYAYASIADVLIRLGIVFLLKIGHIDKLELYAILQCVAQIGMAGFFRYYCISNFKESKFYFIFDKGIFKNVLSYTSWNLLSSVAGTITSHGTVVLLNIYFNPAIVAARSIANQANIAINCFVTNFRSAANPPIIKRYASGDYSGSKHLLIMSATLSYYIMFIIILPVLMICEPILELWLVKVPDYTVPFMQIALVTSLVQVIDTSIYTAFYAKGQIKENAIIYTILGALAFAVTYLLFRIGYSAVSVAWVTLGMNVLMAVVRPILAIKIVNYNWKDIFDIYLPCIKVTILSIPIPLIVYIYRDFIFKNHIVGLLLLPIIGALSVSFAVWRVGLTPQMRNSVKYVINNKLNKLLK